MKKILIRLAIIIVTIYLAVQLFVYIKISQVEANVMKVNPQIDKIISIDSNNDWGEWLRSYTLIVEIKKEQYRIRVNDSGEVEEIEKLT